MPLARLAALYGLFGVIAIGFNLATQASIHALAPDAVLDGAGPVYWAALVAGTGTGLVVKYVLDKRWILGDRSAGMVAHGKRFSLYTLMGVLTKIIFWGTQTLFFLVWQSEAMLYLGGALGLTAHRLHRQVQPRQALRLHRTRHASGMSKTEQLQGWGRWLRRLCDVAAPDAPDAVADAPDRATGVARGLGRDYGDCALNPERTIRTRRLDRMLAFDAEAGILTAEAGVPLAAIIEVFLPRGFFPAVTPGSKFVTIGGAIAGDVHGKNHHVAGSSGNHVLWFDLMDGDGTVRRCSRDEAPNLSAATLGGMGLTGVILRAAIRLAPVESGWIRQRRIVAPDLDAAIDAFESNMEATYSVA